MEELQRLEHLSLVSKVCTELDNHYSMNDKVLLYLLLVGTYYLVKPSIHFSTINRYLEHH